MSLLRYASSRLVYTNVTAKAMPLRHIQGLFTGSNDDSSETNDEIVKRLFDDIDAKSPDRFFQTLDRIERSHGKSNSSQRNSKAGTGFMDGLSESFDTLEDGMDKKLGEAATFTYSEEIVSEDYKFRPDVTFKPGQTYTPQDLDLTKPAVQKSFKRAEFETTTKEVLEKADFRNVRFLANFLTEAGIIIKRSQTRISAKAQRKVAREIKTARAFGLMPFTTMGKKPFRFGASNKDEDQDDFYEENTIGAPAAPYE